MNIFQEVFCHSIDSNMLVQAYTRHELLLATQMKYIVFFDIMASHSMGPLSITGDINVSCNASGGAHGLT